MTRPPLFRRSRSVHMVVDDIDRLLDEIDAVLEEQAVLVNYRRRSGQ
jgi:hypothetical protein